MNPFALVALAMLGALAAWYVAVPAGELAGGSSGEGGADSPGGATAGDELEGAPPPMPAAIRPSAGGGDELLAAMTPGGEVKAAAWSPPATAQPYLPAIQAAERTNALPDGLLARLLYQESRYRPEIINGAVKSSVGAAGIAQFMPQTAADFGIDPLNPFASISAAARYLSTLYGRFGNWAEALAAYNWGQGNVARKGLDAAPTETKNYVAEILRDIPLAGA